MDYILLVIFIIIVAVSVFIAYYIVQMYLQSEKTPTIILRDSSLQHSSLQDSSGSLIQDSSGSTVIETPYSQVPIQDVDDYEYSLVFKNEGDRTMSKQKRNALISQYPLDWTTQPPSSEAFQTGLTKFKESFENAPPPQATTIYSSIDGSSMVPPDSLADQQKEREIIQTYKPKKPQALTTYDIEDAKELIERIYDARGVVPEYKQTGDNQFTIMGVHKKGTEPVYETEANAVASSDAVQNNGENIILVPSHINPGGSDPFFTPDENPKTDDYTRWTPGLERMFAPNAPMKNWY